MEGKARKFAWYDSYTTALMRIEDEGVRRDLAWQLIMFGAYGIEPDFERYDKTHRLAAQMTFDVARYTIDKSISNSENGKKPSATGKKRGRPTKAEQEARRREEQAAEQALARLSEGGDDDEWFIPTEMISADPDAHLESTI